VDLALVVQSAPVSLLELLPVLGCAGGDLLGSTSVGRPPQPRHRRRAVLGHEHVATSSSVQLLEGGLVAKTVAALPCRRHGLPPCSSVSTPVSSSPPPPPSFCACSWWPGQRARHACLCCAMLLLLCSLLCYDCCCCSARACVVIAVAALLELVM
jgi:hypothetical protein